MGPVVKILFACPPTYKFKKYPYKQVLCDDSHSEQKVRVNVPVLLCKIFSTNHDINSVLLDDPGRVRSQITSVVCQI